ncbi:MAG TPA: hypothetical protein VEC11_05960 [Allosphingosinicella sp.]|nr:hypothetical protein [Allosphingosinicella sp.]
MRGLSRRSFLGSVAGAAAAGGALLAVTGPGRAAPARAGDGDFASPVPEGDTFRADPAPGRQTGRNDSDGGEAFDHVGYGAGSGAARREAHAARCAGLRQRLARIGGARPRTPDLERQLAALRPYLARWRCGR